MSLAGLQKNLYKLLFDNNMNVAELERRAGLNKNNVYYVLTGKTRNPSAHILQSVADVFNTTVKDLYESENINMNSSHHSLDLLSAVCLSVIKQIKLANYDFEIDEITAAIKDVYDYSKYNSLRFPDVNYTKWILKQKSLAKSTLIS
jgi:transcriptional regulator with XRE-family HTH domain